MNWTIKTDLKLCQVKKEINPQSLTQMPSFVKRLKLCSINISSIRGEILELFAFLDAHQPHVVAIQETKIDRTITTSELFSEPRGVQLILILANSWARPVILVACEGRGGMVLFLLFLRFHSCSSFFHVPLFHLLYYLFSFPPFSFFLSAPVFKSFLNNWINHCHAMHCPFTKLALYTAECQQQIEG